MNIKAIRLKGETPRSVGECRGSVRKLRDDAPLKSGIISSSEFSILTPQ